MVDRIKITLKDFSGNFENCENIVNLQHKVYQLSANLV
jgi:hypothetical protein